MTLILIHDCSPVRGEAAVRANRGRGKRRCICKSLLLPAVRATFFYRRYIELLKITASTVLQMKRKVITISISFIYTHALRCSEKSLKHKPKKKVQIFVLEFSLWYILGCSTHFSSKKTSHSRHCNTLICVNAGTKSWSCLET